MGETKLTIVIVSFNTRNVLQKCLTSITKSKINFDYTVIVSDNGSRDGSVELVKTKFPSVKLLENGKNLGFAVANNRAKDYCRSTYVLFLNSDTLVNTDVLNKSVLYMDGHPDIGVVSCKTVLPDGTLDKDARRSFPTPWVAFSHLVIPLDKIFPKSRLFSRYWYGYISGNTEHEIDVAQGAFMLVRKNVLDGVGWFDEDYFLDGEDIDLCWKIKQKGLKIVYLPNITIIHLKKASKMSKTMAKRDRIRSRLASVNSMETFYRKNLSLRYNFLVNFGVLLGINLIKLQRYLFVLLGR